MGRRYDLQALIRANPLRGGDAKPGVSQDARRPSRQLRTRLAPARLDGHGGCPAYVPPRAHAFGSDRRCAARARSDARRVRELGHAHRPAAGGGRPRAGDGRGARRRWGAGGATAADRRAGGAPERGRRRAPRSRPPRTRRDAQRGRGVAVQRPPDGEQARHRLPVVGARPGGVGPRDRPRRDRGRDRHRRRRRPGGLPRLRGRLPRHRLRPPETPPPPRAAAGASRVIGSAVVNPAARSAGDRYGHGTHVAGIIAGDGSRRTDAPAGRYVGIAPDANLVSIKIDDDHGRASVLDAIYGLQFAVHHKDEDGIRVVNLSLESPVAGSYRTGPLDAAVEAAWLRRLVVVAAAGNRGRDADAVHYAPGTGPFAITVGAVDDRGTRGIGDDQVAKWSSQGTTQDGFAKPELTAPGSQIVSTIAPGSEYLAQCPSCVVDGAYFRAGGTSMSAPVVSGVVALILQAHPDWTPDQVKWALTHSTRLLKSRLAEVNASAVLAPGSSRIPRANQAIAPSTLIHLATGDVDYTRSSWTRSSWTSAPEVLRAAWSRSSWTCAECSGPQEAIDPARSSWTRSSWTTHWGL